MDSDFQERYQQAEQAYGEGRYSDAHALAMGLLDELNSTPLDADNEAAWYGWRSFVALLLGHISLFGLEQPTEAAAFYEVVLDSQPADTQKQLAQQGLERARLAAEASDLASNPPPTEAQELGPVPEATNPDSQVVDLPDLLQDPFLASNASAGDPNPAPSRRTAMPWLDDESVAVAPTTAKDLEPPAFVIPEPDPEPEPEDPEPIDVSAPQATAEPEDKPIPLLESELVEDEQDQAEPRETSKATDDAMKVLKKHWIRFHIKDLRSSATD